MTLSSSIQRHLIVVAGGTGSRMGMDLPKQFLLLRGRPILVHTLEQFHSWDPNLNIVVVLHPEFVDFWSDLCREHHLLVPHSTVAGGETRFHSVANGLARLQGDQGLVGVHDAVRPLVSHEVISRCFREAEKHGAAVPVVPVVDSLRRMHPDRSEVVDRSEYRKVQTPQCFQLEVLRSAFEQLYSKGFTDDASVVEAAGVKVSWVDGNVENVKITSPMDLAVAEALLG